MDIDLAPLAVLAAVVIVAVVGLYLASAGAGVYGWGLALFAVAVIAAFWLVKRYYDGIDAARH